MARGRAVALDPWRDGRAAVGLRRRGESEVAALRRIGRARLYEDGGVAVGGLAWDGGTNCWAGTGGGPKH